MILVVTPIFARCEFEFLTANPPHQKTIFPATSTSLPILSSSPEAGPRLNFPDAEQYTASYTTSNASFLDDRIIIAQIISGAVQISISPQKAGGGFIPTIDIGIELPSLCKGRLAPSPFQRRCIDHVKKWSRGQEY